jgi:O-antigen/teichoic acid export membrane protein
LIGKSATYLFIESIIATVAGYLLWFILSKISTQDVLGVSSTVVSLSIIFSQIIGLHVGVGVTRFLGKSFSEGQILYTKVLVKASLLIVGLAILVGSGLIIVFKQWLLPAIGFELTVILILLIGTSVLYGLLRSVLIASLRTKSIPTITIISSIFRIVLAIVLLLLGMGAVGITIGYLSGFAMSCVLLTIILLTNLKSVKEQAKQATTGLYLACKSILVASIPSWIPAVMAVVGSNLGTVLVFGIHGSSQAASYFIAISIFYAIDAIRNSLFSVAFPILSAMDDQRKRLAWRMIKMSLVVSLPLSITVMLYSNEVLGLFGPDYVQASMPLKIILLSIFPLTLLFGISTLIYSYGNYWQVLGIGLGLNLPRVLLYFILVSLYGSVGAAISFTVGSIIGFGVAIVIAKRIGMVIFWKELALVIAVPTGLAFTLSYLQVTYIIGIPVMLTLSFVFMFVLRVLSKSEVRESLEILPDRIGRPLINIINRL